MSTPKRFRVPNRRLVSNFRQLPKRFMAGLLRLVFISARFGRTRQAGFVLPTTVLLLLIVSLTAGSLSFRAFSRSASVIAEREQKVVYGAATPAIDRAKAKLEYLFDKRVPSNSTPKSSDLEGYLEDDTLFTIPGDPTDPTRGPETRIDINGDGVLDNAWWFAADVNGDGTVDAANERIVYSILVGHEGQAPGTPTNYKLEDKVSEGKADALVTRNGPIDVESSSNACPVSLGTNEEGWQEISVGNPIIKKNFQINAFVVNSNDVNRTVSALEVQQVRESRKGSKWGAWFKNDLEIFPGAAVDFTWNGAMHTEGSLFLRPTNSDFNLRMISSYNSCLYSENASDIELVKDRAPNNYNSQVIAGGLTGTSPGFGGSSTKLDWYNGPTAVGTQAIGTAQDSINAQPANIDDIALDPIKLFTADELDYRRPEGTTWTKQNDAAFWEQPYAKNRIARTEENDPPFLDDIYRADGRFGPKSVYDTSKGLSLSNAQAKLGDLIASKPLNASFTAAQKNEIDSTSAPFEGLDGYWEKQATDKGAKVIVGERLQLGNPFGWKGAYASEQNPNGNIGVTAPAYKLRNMDSLYPAYDDGGAVANNTINGLSDQSLRLHARSLNDNLAAVQSMAVYHYKSDSKTFPLACMSSVSHPGTNTTKANARTFNLLPKLSGGALSLAPGGTDLVNVDFNGDGNNDVQVDADFFFGYGTNAWEYAPPLGTETAFATAYNDATHPLKKALKNLAFFAGDPKGGSPSFTPVQGEKGGVDPFIHPYPYLSMWGDYSPLRRILEPAANGGLDDPLYAALSIADKTTLQTAACTLGMLATNIQVADSLDYEDTSIQSALIALAGEIGSISATPALTSSDYVPEAYISAFERSGKDAALGLARLLHIKEQVKRDRTYGFLQTPASPTFSYTLTAPQTIAPGQSLTAGTLVQLSFDPTETTGNNFFGFGLPTPATELRFLRLAAVAGGLGVNGVQVGLPKFPSLYYLFPVAQHDYLGNHPTDSTLSVVQPTIEPYIDPDLDGNPATNNGYTATSNKTVPAGTTLYTYEPLVSADLDAIRAEPRVLTTGLTTSWKLPYTIAAAAGRPNQISYDADADGVIDNVATLFQDKSFMDGREMLNVRTVEVDVAMATDADNLQVVNTQVGGQSWFTEGEPATSASGAVQGGIFYAFREDARREDELFRPIASTDPLAEWGNCDSTAEILTAACRMNFDVGAEQDPPIRRLTDASGDNFISTKPVDFYPDPERRPYGFRLSNGKTLNRADDVPTGLTFVTDNALYVQGDFNLHTARRAAGPKAVGDPLEEFYTSVDGNGDGEIAKDEFYGDRGDPATDIDTELFAKPDDGDDWRVVELVADATNILSENFKDGVIRDYFLQPRGATAGLASSSYQNVFRVRLPGVFNLLDGGNRFRYPGSNIDKIFQSKYAATTTDAVADPDPLWPFWIRRNGTVDGGLNTAIFIPDSSDIGNDRPKDLIAAKETTVNALLIGGIIPSRLNLSYGGLHNFPRLNEHWPGHTLNIAGAFYQLNFSTASTGLFEQDINRTGTARGAWEPGVEPIALATGGTQYFYGAPGRQWGYDVAFQYNSPGPVSQRFTGNESVRSEYYKDLPADDPYVQNLQCAQNADGTAVIANPTVTCP
ncbi:hormogonium polysaccharide biosynthesis protein HpsA [Leptothoe sp. PORK10 BA2]|uniref:hormogonium polysaccharide biosynthesis protein HpsA n=1 Tax=Leptothoe sp. PORK10 BA2 TaxID=3110254 RepID=UPI002B2106D8|nr:hormogonium polysaccharide biosynthesis protein HpsA [Leptothoe sp. PORK10 BA2]MEA5466004.1 hormogonium polysaccharide biosynthesis protein HpsA [Leptothoe sp. PORK10 BA2]